MAGSLGMMIFHSRNFRFKLLNARHKLVLRIGVEAFASQAASRVMSHTGKVVIFHEIATSSCDGLLSMLSILTAHTYSWESAPQL